MNAKTKEFLNKAKALAVKFALLVTAWVQRLVYRRTIKEDALYIQSLQLELDHLHKELKYNRQVLQNTKEDKEAAQSLARGLKEENKRFADRALRQATEMRAREIAAESAKEELANEKIGYSALDDTNRALEKRLQNVLVDMFPKGPGVYMINFDEKTRQAFPFKIPQKLQKKITKILTDDQKTALKKKKV